MNSEQSSISGVMIGIVAIIAIVAITLFAVQMIQSQKQDDANQDIFPIIDLTNDESNSPSKGY